MAAAVQPELAIAWAPQSAPQEALITCPVEDVFYGGARGGGKTDALLGDFAAHAGQHGKHAHGVLFRRTYPELEEVERRSQEIYGPLGWSYNQTKKTWTAPNGAQLKLRYLLRDKDAEAYQGHSYTWQGWDELTNWSSAGPLDRLWATLRSAHGVPCYRRSTGNPGGAGHGWVKRRYIDPAPEGYKIFRQTPNPKQPNLTIETVFIPSKLDDNPLIASHGYEARIAAATADNDALYEAWRHGRWDVFVGQQYAEFRQAFHVITPSWPPEQFPAHTEWFATLDWGWRQGAYGLHAVNNEGDVELVWEFYDGFKNLSAEDAASTIASLHQVHGWPLPKLIHGDSQMFQRVGTAVTLAEEFAKGLTAVLGEQAPPLIEAKHPPGSREVKVAMIHAWLTVGKMPGTRTPATKPDGTLFPWAFPAYRIHDRCVNTIRVLQEIPADPENPNDVDPDYADDHCHDMVGFAVASRPPKAIDPQAGKRHSEDQHPGFKRGTGDRNEPKRAMTIQEWVNRARDQRGGYHLPRSKQMKKVDL